MYRRYRRRYYNYENVPEESLETSCCNVENDIYDTNECECGFTEEEHGFPNNPMYAQSYVVTQVMGRTFTPEIGLKMGTIFPELVSPYVPNQTECEIEYIKSRNDIGNCNIGGCNNG